MSDKELMQEYWKGWHDEVEGRNMQDWFKNDLAKRAYMVGRMNASNGENIPSNSYKMEETILKEIKDGK